MNWKIALQFLGVACLILMGDAFLKAYVHVQIPPFQGGYLTYPYEGIGVFRNWHGIEFSLVHVKNLGAVCGLFSDFYQYLLYARMLIIGGLFSYLLFVKNTVYVKFSLLLIMVGAVGNVIDYFIYGHVVDMFYFVFWGFSYPVFNIADSAICIGIGLLTLKMLFERGKPGVRSVSPSR